MFGEVVCEIIGTFSPVYEKMTLLDTVTDPIKTHIHGFGTALFYGVVADAGSACIIGLDGGRWLWVAHVSKSGAEHGCLFAVVEECAELGFGG
jgi:hypothetical protein